MIDNFEWVIAQQGYEHWVKKTPLVLANRSFFNAPKGENVETATAIGRTIMTLIGLENARITFEPLPSLPDEIAHEYGKTSEIAGQYWHDESAPLITYDPRLMNKPSAFINTLSHELMHALLADKIDDIPGGNGAHELATDLHCITRGFGLFQLNAAETVGWAGYMTQPSRAMALAMFLYLTKTPQKNALEGLGPSSAKFLRRAIKECERHWLEDLDQLMILP